MKPMSEAHFAILRRHMVEVIGIQVDLASEELGKAALDERVLTAMRKVPRHRFVPSSWPLSLTRTRRCRSASIRRSRSPS
jgi:protein-L-isoaspartate(D-aspartate) O-methyltransferase